MDILSEYENMDIMLGGNNSNSIERVLENMMDGPACKEDTVVIPTDKLVSKK